MSYGVRVALAVGLVLALAALAVVLSRSPLTVVGTNGIPSGNGFSAAKRGVSKCQQIPLLPAGTSAIRVSAIANVGPRVSLRVLSGPVVITHGVRVAGWGSTYSVTVPVTPVTRAIANPTICVAFGPTPVGDRFFLAGTFSVNGLAPGQAPTDSALSMRFEYLRPGPASWWSLSSSVITRMGFGHAASGMWLVFLVIAAMIAVATLAARLILREMR